MDPHAYSPDPPSPPPGSKTTVTHAVIAETVTYTARCPTCDTTTPPRTTSAAAVDDATTHCPGGTP